MTPEGWKVHRLGKVDVSSKDDPSQKWSLLCKTTLTIRIQQHDGEVLTLEIPFEDLPPTNQYSPNLKLPQIQTLWVIAECDVMPEADDKSRSSANLAKLLGLEQSQFARDVAKPLEKRVLIYSERRKTTNPKSSQPNKREKGYHLKEMNMRQVFYILLDYFQKNHFNDLTNWRGSQPVDIKDMTTRNRIAEIRLAVLARLQKRINDYESSAQFYIDMGVNPPLALRVAEISFQDKQDNNTK